MFPLWTLDSKRIVYSSIREGEVGVYWRAADGTGEAELLASEPYRMIVPLSWSSDGKTLALQRMSLEVPPTQIPLLMRVVAEDSLPPSLSRTPATESDIALLSVEGDRELKPLLADKYLEGDPQISPDGRWIAYVSDEAGQDDVYVRPYPEVNGGKWRISTSGGRGPNWSPDGRELLYKSGDAIMGVSIDSGTAFTAREPQKLFQGNYYYDYLLSRWAIHPNGKQFLMIKTNAQVDDESTEAAPNQINIVVNWFEELKQKVPVD
jgi:Tol biopolymer transport system component